MSRTLKVRGGIISQANSYLGGFCFSQRIFPPQICQVLLLIYRLSRGVPTRAGLVSRVIAGASVIVGSSPWRSPRCASKSASTVRERS